MEFIINNEFFSFMTEIKNNSSHEEFMYLSIFVDCDDENLKKLYCVIFMLFAFKNFKKVLLFNKFQNKKGAMYCYIAPFI